MSGTATAGLCECGCGFATRIAPHSDTSKGWVRGQPLRFLKGHNGRVREIQPLLSRLLPKIEKTPTCWLWTGSLNNRGYGQTSVTVGGRQSSRLAHRLVYEALVGPIPNGLEIDHLCQVTRCCNPAHLEPVTHLENVRRALARRVPPTTCGRGHPRTPENWRPSSCLACRRVRWARRKAGWES